MEALFFRLLVRELPPLLLGRRLENIHCPRRAWWTLSLQSCEHPRFLLFAHHPGTPALALCAYRPANPPAPPAQVMRLRKPLLGLRILDFQEDWLNRRLALGLGRRRPESWLILDARTGLGLEAECPPWNPFSEVWPSLEEIRDDPDIWQTHPQLSPLLRRSLTALPAGRDEALYASLQRGGTDMIRLYEDSRGRRFACPWTLPEKLCQGLRPHVVGSALEAASMIAECVFFPELPGSTTVTGASVKKHARLLQRLDQDEQRMIEFCMRGGQAELIRAGLHDLPKHARLDRVRVTGPDGSARVLELDPRKTVLQNMEHWYGLAEKGRRGLAQIRRRRDELLRRGAETLSAPAGTDALAGLSRRLGAGKAGEATPLGLPVHSFLSSDGFTMLRGRNQKANHALLARAASPFDYWFHAQDVPGAHVILKRDHPGREVPEQSMREAAVLAGLASHFAGAGRASVICAEVRHVRAVKGAPGMAAVSRIHRTLFVELDPGLETRLKKVPEACA